MRLECRLRRPAFRASRTETESAMIARLLIKWGLPVVAALAVMAAADGAAAQSCPDECPPPPPPPCEDECPPPPCEDDCPPPPCEDVVTLAATAASRCLRAANVDPRSIGLLIVATETAVDSQLPGMSVPIATV